MTVFVIRFRVLFPCIRSCSTPHFCDFFPRVGDKHLNLSDSVSTFRAESETEKFSEKKLRTESIKLSKLCEIAI